MVIKDYLGREMKPRRKDATLLLRVKREATFEVNGIKRCLYHDVKLLNYMLKNKYFNYSHKMSVNFSFAEIIQATEDVSEGTLDYLVKYAKWHGKKLNPEPYIALVNNIKILEWFLKRGYKCKHYPGYGDSTMELLLRYSDIPTSEAAELIKKYDATDKKYLASDNCPNQIKVLFE